MTRTEPGGPFWTLDQLRAWIETRDPDIVRFAALGRYAHETRTSLEIAVAIEQAMSRAKAAGRDVDVELWARSGWTPRPAEPPPLPFPAGSADRFPTIAFVMDLLRSGSLTAIASLPGETLSRQLSPADWTGLEIAVGGAARRLSAWRIGAVKSAGEGDLEWFRLPCQQVMALFPATLDGREQRPAAAATPPLPARRGRKPLVGTTVMAAMREFIAAGGNLKGMSEKEMRTAFRASRDTCRRIRSELLSLNVENSIPDKSSANDK